MIAGGIDVAALGACCGTCGCCTDFDGYLGCSAGVATGADFAGGFSSLTGIGVTLAPVAAATRDCKAS